MPYEIVRNGSGFLIRKKHGDKKILGHHPSKESAERQLRAIEANSHEHASSGQVLPGNTGTRVEVRPHSTIS